MERTEPRSDGCLNCTYSLGSHGYPQAWDGETVVLAHRIVWEHHHGPVPEGMTVDHRQDVCGNKRCVEIEHLRLLTNLDNARRNATGRDWPLDGRCVRGHDAKWWKPKGPTRQKGYCHGCRMEQQARSRGQRLRKDYGSRVTDKMEEPGSPGSEKARSEMVLYTEESRCPACGQPIDYCQGHGSLGDPHGAEILAMHDRDNHSQCHPDGCDG